MTKNPFLNALAASAYIIAVTSFIHWLSQTMSGPDNEFLAPIAFLSLLTLSVAMMGYIFLFQPIQLYFSDKKKEGAKLFVQTIGAFAALTVIAMIVLITLG